MIEQQRCSCGMARLFNHSEVRNRDEGGERMSGGGGGVVLERWRDKGMKRLQQREEGGGVADRRHQARVCVCVILNLHVNTQGQVTQ